MLNIFQKGSARLDVEQRFGNAEMRRRADRQELGQTLDDAEHDGERIVAHQGARWRGGAGSCAAAARASVV